ncbi:hypothetical protein KZX06_01320 [Micrococcus sp. EYE_162]|uniref:LURP-one-related/scramblase family protein n=1 Tax=unclassified Micrococcus TaxID=2620948 RepID=UPI0020049F5C|nr:MULTISPECIES: hypothetical protein [unclassified Micrococcus]MCK6094511.1 hypothetical protein [Micrococcus sp. EYE_212]MCK6170692.1 hypothetical protein [Micrococcus sp. EYE_162]
MTGTFDVGRLAHVNAVTVQQMTTWNSNDMAILGPDGETVATVVTRGGGLSRMLMGSREFDVVDGEDGRVLFHLQDPATFGRDRFQVFDAQGYPLANVAREFAFFRTAVSVEVVDGTRFSVTGDLFDYDYTFAAGERQIARVTAEFAGFLNALAGRSRYQLTVDPAMPPVVRCAVLGTAIALDLLRAKDQRKN